MKQNIKLFFASLISNNACIDGARKKPWYAAIIIFFISLILSVVPTTVFKNKEGKTLHRVEGCVEKSQLKKYLDEMINE